MKSAFSRRYRRRSKPARTEGTFFKKESQETFFSGPEHDNFFQPATTSLPAQPVQRSGEDESKVQRAEKKEEEKVQKAEEKKEEKVMKMGEKKEEEKVQKAEDKKEEKVMKMGDKKEEEKVQKAEDKKEEKVMKMEEKKEEEKVQKAEEKKEEEKVHKKESGAPAGGAKTVSNYIGTLNGKGQSLPAQANEFYSSRMGYDFSNVKLHTDKQAAQTAKDINAKAYTTGNNIVFNEGQYNLESGDGKKLMAHELTHVIQQDKSTDHDAAKNS